MLAKEVKNKKIQEEIDKFKFLVHPEAISGVSEADDFKIIKTDFTRSIVLFRKASCRKISKTCRKSIYCTCYKQEIDGRIYLGEMTYYPGGGILPFDPEEWDHKIGEWYQLPEQHGIFYRLW